LSLQFIKPGPTAQGKQKLCGKRRSSYQVLSQIRAPHARFRAVVPVRRPLPDGANRVDYRPSVVKPGWQDFALFATLAAVIALAAAAAFRPLPNHA